MTSIFMQDCTRADISEAARAGAAAVVPLAATEQHGPHLPVFTDSLVCEHIARQAGERAGARVPLMIAPTLPIGCSDHHLAFGGTLSFSSTTYLAMLRDLGESLVKDGFRKIVFLNGHGGNEPIMHQTANDLAVRHPVWTASASYWSVAGEALRSIDASRVGMVPGHAGGFETAAILALRPELVRRDRISQGHVRRPWINAGPPGAFLGRHLELTGYDGYTDSPAPATPELGRLYLDTIVAGVADWLVRTVRAMEEGERKP